MIYAASFWRRLEDLISIRSKTGSFELGQSLSGLVQTPVLELREEFYGLSCSTQNPERFVGFLQAQVSLDLTLADGMSLKTHLQVIDAESTYDILLGMDFM